MRIVKLEQEYLEFDNGMTIESTWNPDCYEYNFADFTQLEDTVAMDYDFNEELKFKPLDDIGFRFGDNNLMVFVPCYSDQNGYYSNVAHISFNGEELFSLTCEII